MLGSGSAATPAAVPGTAPVAPIPAGTSADAACIPELIHQGSTPEGLQAARATATRELASRGLPPSPKNACALHLSALLQQAGIAVPMTAGAGKLAATIEARGWRRVPVRQQAPGDIGVCFDNDTAIPGSDHVYLVIACPDDDQMMIADNQGNGQEPHSRSASGRDHRTPTEYFLRAP